MTSHRYFHGVLLDYVWDSAEFIAPKAGGKWNRSIAEANGYEYFYSLMDCVESSPEDRELVRNIVGYLNMPLDIDLLEAVIGEGK